MKKDEPIRFVYFADGREISRKQAESGKFVLCGYSEEPNTVYVFDHEGSPELVARWAQERRIGDKVAALDAEAAAPPPDLTDEVMASGTTAGPSVTVYQLQDVLESATKARLTASTPDVKQNGLTGAALSARVEGSIGVRFYRDTNYQHSVYTQMGPKIIRTIPHGALSVKIVPM